MAIAVIDAEERIIVSRPQEIAKIMRGDGTAEIYFDCTRPLGAIYADLKSGGTVLIEAVLLLEHAFEWLKGERKNRKEIKDYYEGYDGTIASGEQLEQRAVRILSGIWESDNCLEKFAAMRIWQEYVKANDLATEKRHFNADLELLQKAFIRIIYPFKQGMYQIAAKFEPFRKDSFLENPVQWMGGNLASAIVCYSWGTNKYEYACDTNILGLKEYYKQKLLSMNLKVLECQECRAVFLGKSVKSYFCCDECRRVHKRKEQKLRRSDENVLAFDKLYNSEHSYWDTRRMWALKDSKLQAIFEELWKWFVLEEKEQREKVCNKKNSIDDLRAWYMQQRDIVDALFDEDQKKE